MKRLLFTAAALVAAPLAAQTSPVDPAPPPNRAPVNQTAAPAADLASTPDDVTNTARPAAPAGGLATTDPVGGYQPSTPMPPAGTATVFQPAPSPSQAFPAPAPLSSYPLCKKGQYDDCRERSTPSGARHPSQPR